MGLTLVILNYTNLIKRMVNDIRLRYFKRIPRPLLLRHITNQVMILIKPYQYNLLYDTGLLLYLVEAELVPALAELQVVFWVVGVDLT